MALEMFWRFFKFHARSDGTLHAVEFPIRARALHQHLTSDADEPTGIVQYELRNYAATRGLWRCSSTEVA